MTSKDHILSEIRRTTLRNEGKPLGQVTFENETGIQRSDWHGIHWVRWGDALKEAGFEPNLPNQAYESDFLCKHYAMLVRELGHIPVSGDLRIKARNDKVFPSHNVWTSRLGTKDQLLKLVRSYCEISDEWQDVLDILSNYLPNKGFKKQIIKISTDNKNISVEQDGYVYLIKSERHYKIGMTNDIHRRANEISIELPERSETIHVIRTDDASGIEAYWHKRFLNKRGNGEWFNLTPSDIKAFKRRKFI